MLETMIENMKDLPIREQGATLALHTARTVEALLNLMNQNEDDFVVSDEHIIILEDDMHEDIAQYMKLWRSLNNSKPTA